MQIYTHPKTKSLGSTLMAKQHYHVAFARLYRNTLHRSGPLKAQTLKNGIYVIPAMNKFTGVQ